MDSTGKEKEAIQLMAEADKKVRSSGSFLGGMFGGNQKVEEACEMYARAANMFKMAKNWSAAGNAFCQAARLHMQLQNKHDSATSFIDAGNAFKKADPQEAIKCLNAAIDIYTDMELPKSSLTEHFITDSKAFLPLSVIKKKSESVSKAHTVWNQQSMWKIHHRSQASYHNR
uniref:N-ethylmaleimide-sensitive factor attachment protein, beta b n=1 Tax=Cyprinus carpio carpio TaxID=630221 RepID=A0A8C0YE73_CYPCA